jgi:hypothetical protein
MMPPSLQTPAFFEPFASPSNTLISDTFRITFIRLPIRLVDRLLHITREHNELLGYNSKDDTTNVPPFVDHCSSV